MMPDTLCRPLLNDTKIARFFADMQGVNDRYDRT